MMNLQRIEDESQESYQSQLDLEQKKKNFTKEIDELLSEKQ